VANLQLRAEFGPIYAGVIATWLRFSDVGKYRTIFPLADAALNQDIATAYNTLKDVTRATEEPGVDILPLLAADWTTMPFRAKRDYSDGDRNPSDMTNWLSARMVKGTFTVHGSVYGRSIFSDGTIQSLRVVHMRPWKFKYSNDKGNVKIVIITFGKVNYALPESEHEFRKAVLAFFAVMVGSAYPSTQFRYEIAGTKFAASGGGNEARTVIELY
jgi:hypothetical protein